MPKIQQTSGGNTSSQTQGEYSVLIVDDDSVFTEYLRHLLVSDLLLERIGNHTLRVEDAGSVQEARGLIREHYDIVLLDINVPFEEGASPQREHGPNLLREIKKTTPESEVIMLSGYGTEDDIVEAINEGAFYYLAKPFRSELLAALLARVIEKKESERRAWTDGFTGLYNKTFFEFSLKNEIRKFPRNSMPARRHLIPLSLILLDFDHLKEYNDRYGHLEGDYVIKKVASIIRKTTRSSDIVARNGGDEFGILLVGANHFSALRQAERIRRVVYEQGLEYAREKNLPMTVSLGVATFPSFLEGADDLYKAADDALYASKRSGRNAVYGYTESGEVKSFQELVGLATEPQSSQRTPKKS